ncbi:MAG: triose-phosphate isomerase [Chthonomonadaceae bacterium]|nr:triose-phosphate isomerase [Chthonomonadaceae bacterium]
MPTKLVVGNWKMNLSVAQASALVTALTDDLSARPNVDVVVCPPYLSIPRVKELTRNTHVKVGAQDVFWVEEGAFTGQVSSKMLHDQCVDYCLVGHSETRGKFGKLEVPESTIGFFAETDETVNLKIKALLYYGLVPILCVGETLAEREAGRTEAVIETQVKGALEGVESAELYSFVVAYEPVWAIGTGQTCESEEAGRVCRFVRSTIASVSSDDAAASVRVLYGGSVKPTNSDELFAQDGIDGGLVGGASLEADGFARIVLSAS